MVGEKRCPREPSLGAVVIGTISPVLTPPFVKAQPVASKTAKPKNAGAISVKPNFPLF